MIPNFRISDYFMFYELVNTNEKRYQIKNIEGSVPFLFNLTMLCRFILDVAREIAGHPLIVTSGFRCADINQLVGGGANSKHKEGLAADVVFEGIDWEKALDLGKRMVRKFLEIGGLKCDVIVEKRGSKVWLHLEQDDAGPRLWTGVDKVYTQETP